MALSRYAERLAAPSVEPEKIASALSPHEDKRMTAGQSRASISTGPVTATLQQEPEDARLTGGTRSLSRRLLALNIPLYTPRPAIKTSPIRKASVKVKNTLLRSSKMAQPAI